MPFEATTAEALNAAFHFNIAASFELTRAAVGHLRERPGAAIVAITSMMGHIAGRGLITYGTVKAGADHMMCQLAAELAPRFRANAVAPGIIATEGLTAAVPPNVRDQIAAATPLRRLGSHRPARRREPHRRIRQRPRLGQLQLHRETIGRQGEAERRGDDHPGAPANRCGRGSGVCTAAASVSSIGTMMRRTADTHLPGRHLVEPAAGGEVAEIACQPAACRPGAVAVASLLELRRPRLPRHGSISPWHRYTVADESSESGQVAG